MIIFIKIPQKILEIHQTINPNYRSLIINIVLKSYLIFQTSILKCHKKPKTAMPVPITTKSITIITIKNSLMKSHWLFLMWNPRKLPLISKKSKNPFKTFTPMDFHGEKAKSKKSLTGSRNSWSEPSSRTEFQSKIWSRRLKTLREFKMLMLPPSTKYENEETDQWTVYFVGFMLCSHIQKEVYDFIN